MFHSNLFPIDIYPGMEFEDELDDLRVNQQNQNNNQQKETPVFEYHLTNVEDIEKIKKELAPFFSQNHPQQPTKPKTYQKK